MKIEAEPLQVTRSGSFQESTFGIAQTAKAFDILSSKIYTDAILAIVRELSTNAHDSHVAAGCPEKPFDVHLPNHLEPHFSIRDYGTGLSPQDVTSVYTTYFRSTRSGSDDFTGCLGLGSKSPFAYTDQFTITSFWGGKKYVYSAFKNEEGNPTISLLSTVDTDEPNGVEIHIGVKSGDSAYFVAHAKKIYTFFKVKPSTNLSIANALPEPIFKGDGFELYDGRKGFMGTGIYVVMGQICYPTRSNHVGLGNDATLILHLPIGSCSIAASREELHYDKKTTDAINAATVPAVHECQRQVEEVLKDEPVELLKAQKSHKYTRFLRTRRSNVQFNITDDQDPVRYSMKPISLSYRGKLEIGNRYHYGYFNATGEVGSIVFIEEDADLDPKMKIKLSHYLESQGAKSGDKQYFLAKITDQKYFAETFGPANIKLSLLPDAPKKVRPPKNPNALPDLRSKPIKTLTGHTSGLLADMWDCITDYKDVSSTDACCVPRDGNWVIWNGKKMAPADIHRIATTLGYKTVYGIAEKRYESLRDKFKLEELEKTAQSKAEALAKSLDKYAIARWKWENAHSNVVFSEKLVKRIKGLSPECDEVANMFAADSTGMHQYNSVCATFNVKIPDVPNYVEIFLKKYPILVAIDWYRSNNDGVVVDYIKLVEEKS